MYRREEISMRTNFSTKRRRTLAGKVGRLSQHAHIILRRRYLAKDARGMVSETPDLMFRRVAANIAAAERLYPVSSRLADAEERFHQLMSRLEFLPNSPTLMNAGRELQQLSACFILPVEDSLESIFDATKQQALIHQSGGGTGFSFSRLRPMNDRVASTNGVASGPVSFMRVFNSSTEVIKQGGARRGANMGILSVDHPDILDFVALKQDPRAMTNFNLSVAVTDSFMKAAEQDRPYGLVNPRTGRTVRRESAQRVFDRIAHAAWNTGEPGLLFVDTINRANPTPELGAIEATNPCGEQPLLPYESCTLGSLNLARFVTGLPGSASIDYAALSNAVIVAVRFLDNVIDMNRYPLPAIEARTKSTRKIGLGLMGFADLLIHLDIPYESDEAIKTGEEIMRLVQEQAHAASRELGTIRGVFPAFEGSRLAAQGLPRRHATVTTIAPTGTISIIADCSPGIEPLYGVAFTRTVMDNVRLVSIHPEFEQRIRKAGLYSKKLIQEVQAHESIQHLTRIPGEIRRLFLTAHDISVEHHVRMQAAFQKYSDSGVSKTINLPHSATKADVASAFLSAYRLDCKGLTVFRSGSRNAQVFSCARMQSC
jgi:ribonucleoside-diphosphate reductase alpha chain